jgi:hypothetical protein
MTAIRARIAAPPTPTTTPMTIFLLLSLRPDEPELLCSPGTRVGINVVEAIVVAIVVATPLIVVTKSVVIVLTEREYEVIYDVEDSEDDDDGDLGWDDVEVS